MTPLLLLDDGSDQGICVPRPFPAGEADGLKQELSSVNYAAAERVKRPVDVTTELANSI